MGVTEEEHGVLGLGFSGVTVEVNTGSKSHPSERLQTLMCHTGRRGFTWGAEKKGRKEPALHMHTGVCVGSPAFEKSSSVLKMMLAFPVIKELV